MINPPRVKIPGDPSYGFPDAEMALVTIIDEIVSDITPDANAFSLDGIPHDYEERVNRGEVIITVKRSGGESDGVFDFPRMDVAVGHAYRTDSWRVMGFIRRKLHQFSGLVTNPDGSEAIVNSITDATGPQRTPQSPDTRVVALGFSMQTRVN